MIPGGAAGPIVAARLSEVEKWNVLLIEAGPDEPAGAEIPSYLQAYLGNTYILFVCVYIGDFQNLNV